MKRHADTNGASSYPATPDGRYFVVRGRLWRRTNPAITPAERDHWVEELMAARRAKGHALRANDQAGTVAARDRVDVAKHALGERGPVWWTDNAPDYNRFLARNTPYADWYDGVQAADVSYRK